MSRKCRYEVTYTSQRHVHVRAKLSVEFSCRNISIEEAFVVAVGTFFHSLGLS